MRCVRFKHLNLLLYPSLDCGDRLLVVHKTHQRNAFTQETPAPMCLNPWLKATTSLSAVLHEVADWPEDLHARGNTLPDFGLTSSKCIPLTLRVNKASPFQSASVESSRPGVPTNSRDASALRYAINLTSAASSMTVHRVTLVVNLRTAVEISGLPARDAKSALAT